MKQEDRYLSKLERFFEEEEFISAHRVEDEVTERALLHSLEIAVEVSMDVIAMKIRDMGLKVDDDATNIEKITSGGIISKSEADFLRQMKNFKKVLSKTVAAVYTAYTYGEAIRGYCVNRSFGLSKDGVLRSNTPMRPQGAQPLMNGMRNFIVHRYNKLDMGIVNEALSRIGELKGIIVKIAEY